MCFVGAVVASCWVLLYYMSSYSFSLTTFSPSGKLGQIEHALAAVSSGKPAIGIKCKKGVILATEKKFGSPLADEDSISKIASISGSLGAVYAGMPPDFRVVLKRARKAAGTYVANYREAMPARQLVLDVSGTMQEFTQRGGVRPFGISVLIAGVDAQTGQPSLFQVDPSGAFFAWKATAVGRNFVNSKVFLEKRYSEDLEVEDAIHTALLCLKESFEGAMNEGNVEVGIVTVDNPVFRVLRKEELRDYLAEVL